MENRSPIPITLSLRARTEGEWLLVEYEAKNASAGMVFCYDGAPGDPGQDYPDLSAHLGLFVRWEEPATVAVKRILGAPPAGRKVTKVIIPSLSRIDAGQSREVRFRLPLPLTEKCEFSPNFAQAIYEARNAKTLQIVLGHMVLPPGSAAEPFSGNPRAWRVRGAHGPQQLATASTSLAVPVKVRTDGSFYCP
jgi:hypothetical protein